MTLLFTLLAFIFVLGVLILVHEFGHFWAARRVGVAVEAFSIGFGRKLLSWKRGETEYRICALPLGGYVKMLAENPDEGVTGDPREFGSRTRPERFFIMVMGAVFNILLAYVLWVGVLMVGEQKEEWLVSPADVGYVEPDGAGAEAGLRVGDRIVEVNSEPVKNWEQVLMTAALNPREEIEIVYQRDGAERSVTVRPAEDEKLGIGRLDVGPASKPVINAVEEGTPAAAAGLRGGDRIVEVNGIEINNFQQIAGITRRYKEGDEPMSFVVERDGQPREASIAPLWDGENEVFRIGITSMPMETVTVSAGLIGSFTGAAERCVVTTGQLFDVVGKMLTGRLSTKAISGPVGIASMSGRAAEQGIVTFLNLMAVISLNLGILNLLPIPIFDGGQITILLIEGLIGRDLSDNVKLWVMRVGLVLLFSLFFLVLYQDIDKLVSGFF